MKKRMLVLFFTILIYSTTFGIAHVSAISAASYCIMEAETKSVLYAHNAETKMGMASTTKIMTAILALESGKADEIASVSPNAAQAIGSSLYLKQGEKMKVYDLVCGLMLNSGNDAAIVLAEHISGDVKTFVDSMNAKAMEIGAKQTHFVNPNGLSDPEHYTTAEDLAIITAYALNNSDFKNIVATKQMQIKTIGEQSRTIYLHNHNKLLSLLEGCEGVKTGFTKATGRCLVSSAFRNGMRTVCVTLNAPDDWNDHTTLHNLALENYEYKVLVEKGTHIGKAKVDGGIQTEVRYATSGTVGCIFQKNSTESVELKIELSEHLSAPIVSGQEVGRLIAYKNGSVVGETKLVAEFTVLKKPEPKFADKFKLLYINVF